MEETKSASKTVRPAAPTQRGRDKEETAVQGVASPAGRPVVARNPETDRLRQADNPALEIPAILLEGDRSPPPPVSGPGRRYALGTAAPGEQGEKAEFQRELPEAYGTKRLMLAPRDPHWVYAHWDLTSEQQRQCNELSAEGLLILRVHADSLAGERVAQVHVHPESRHWFVHVGQAGRTYVAELGCTNRDREWVSIAVSEAARTPPDTMSADT